MKRSTSSKNQSTKRSRRSLRIGQQQFGPFWTENTNDNPTESSNQTDTSSIPDWLNIPFFVWDHQLIKFLGLKQVAIMRGVNSFFEPCWVRRFKMNLLPLRVPYDIETLDRAMRVIEILIDRQEHVVAAFNLVKKDIEIHENHYKRAWGNLLYNHTKIKSAKDLHIFYHLGIRAASYYGLQVPKPTSGKYSSEGASIA